MSLCRYLPTPSDRMSILWSLLCVKDAVVLEYGPAGTTHYSMILYGKLGVEQDNKLFTTHMNEDDVIMGNTSRLEKAILEVDRCSNAKIIFVVASSISSIIGTDIKGVCNEMQEHVRAKLICFEQGGLKGDYSVGLSESYKLLAKEFAKKNREKKEKTYNIIGLSLGQYRAHSDLWALEDLMQEAFGYTLFSSLCSGVDIEQLEDLGSAQINLAIRHEGVAAAKLLEKRCNTPYIVGSPYGYQGTLDWLKEVSEIIGEDINPELLARLQEKAKDLAMSGRRMKMMRSEIPVATVVGDYDRVTGLAKVLEEYCVDINALICDHSLIYVNEKNPLVQHITNEKEKVNIIEQCKNQLILADDVTLEISDESNSKLLVSAPFFKGTIAKHLPLVAEKGMDFLAEHISAYISKTITIKR